MSGKRGTLRVVGGHGATAYSPGPVVESLQSAGVETDVAIRIARNAEKQFRGPPGERATIELEALLAWIVDKVRDASGDETAARFGEQVPPFVPLRVERSAGVEAFSRRTLTKSLETIDLEFKDAYGIAALVEQALRAEGQAHVAARDLAQRVALALEARYGRDVRLRYEERVAQPAELLVVEPDGGELPYSRGILARSLMAVGLGPELSHNLAKRAETALWAKGETRLSRSEVRTEVVRLIEAEAGSEFARRYLLMRNVRRPDEPLVLLIGGAAGVGKSALASEIGYRLGIPRIVSTDSVRQALRSLIGPELSPVLHSSSYDAWLAELLPAERANARPKRKRVIRGFQAQVQQLATALSAIVERNVSESTSIVMEGIHLVPGIGSIPTIEGATVVQLLLVVDDADLHRHHFDLREGRTRSRRAKQGYLDHFKEIRILQDFIREQGEHEGVPVVEAADFDAAVERAVDVVLDVVLAQQGLREGIDSALDALVTGSTS